MTSECKPLEGLHLVATPIGNYGDISKRALETLSQATLIFCEDTRVTGKMLATYGIKASLHCYNDFSGNKEREKIIEKLKNGASIALVSDAGTPLISDPGYKLVKACHEHHIAVTALPGPCAVINALILSGLPTDRFLFDGFLEAKTSARLKQLSKWEHFSGSLIYYETARRLFDALADIKTSLGNRPLAVLREMTKEYEEIIRDDVQAVIRYYQEHPDRLRGEIVLVVGPGLGKENPLEIVNQQAFSRTVKQCGAKEAAAIFALQTGLRKKELYNLALELKQ